MLHIKARIAVRAVAFALIAVVPVAAGCANSTTPAGQEQETPVNVTTFDGYALKGDPKSAIEYTGNKLIFTSEIVGLGSPRKVDRKTETGDRITYIYTPVTVKVTRVLRGAQLRAGEEVAIRVIGGQIGSEKTVSKVNPAPDQFQQGMKLFLFTQEFVDAGDGLVAATPNFTYAEDSGGNVYNLHEPEHKTSLSIFSAGVREWTGFNPS